MVNIRIPFSLVVTTAADLGTIDPALIRLMNGGRHKLVEINDYLKYNKMYIKLLG